MSRRIDVASDLRLNKRTREGVRYRRSWRSRCAGFARTPKLVRDDGVWMTKVMFFGMMAGGLTVLGGLVHAVVMWPWMGLYYLLPALGLLGFSFGVAVRVRRPEGR